MKSKAHTNECDAGQADCFLINDCGVATDDARVFHGPHSPETRQRRKVNLFRQFLITDAALSQKSSDDVAILAVHDSTRKMGIVNNNRKIMSGSTVLFCRLF